MIAAVHQTTRISHPLAGRRTRAFERCRRIAAFLETIVSGGKRDRHAERCFISVPQFSMTPSKDSVKPVHVIRLRGITASVFANTAETKNGDVTFHKVSVQRTYKDGNEFKTTTSFGRDDLPIVRLLTDRAWQFILDTEATRGREDSAE